jgi:PAS domain S-box-containing protein
VYNTENVYIRRDGSMFPVSVTSSPIRREGEVVGAVLSFRDLTEQKRAEAALIDSEFKLRAMFDNTSDAILIADDAGNYLDANPAAAEVIGVPRDGILGRNVLDFSPPEYREAVRESWQQFLRDGEQEGEFPFFRPDGTTRYLEYKARANFLPGRHLSVLRDVTIRKRMEEALRHRAEALDAANRRNEETVALLDTLLANAPIGFAYFDREYRYVRINGFLSEINGFPVEAHMGHALREIVPANADAVEPMIDRVFRTGDPVLDVEIEGETPAAPGVRRHWLTDYFPVLTGDGHLPWVGVLVTEISERKRMEEALRSSEEQFRTLIEQSPLSVQILSPGGETLQVNRAWEKLWGIPISALQGYNMLQDQQLIDLGIMPYILRGFAGEAAEVPPVRYDRNRTLPHVATDENPERWVRAFIYPVRDPSGEIVKVVLIHEDVSERQRLEEELRRRAEELAEEGRRKDNYLAMLAHELRNPLAPIVSAVHVMKMQGTDDPALLRSREVIERQVGHMARLIDNLLELSRLDRGKIVLQKRPLDLRRVLEDAAASVRPTVELRRHDLNVVYPDPPVTVEADPDRLEQILVNLLNNAAKYTEPGGRIDLIGEARGGEVVFRVRDTGIGIEPEMLPHVFDLFAQADRSLDRSRGGLGIGLTLVKNLVRLHGGTVEAHSAGPGQGSEFVVRFPAARTEPPPVQESRLNAAPAPQTPLDLLLVEDNADGREMLRNLLELWGHRLEVAENGAEGLERALRNPPQAAVIDIGLPSLDGYEVARRLRAELGERCPYLIALTGYGQPEARQKSLDAGFDAHLVKPADPVALSRLLARVGRGAGSEGVGE